ncbi:RNA methyltransferase [Kiloniella laminariae]|uniref:RNA methyltransferase n=1 Tax=Kiloniella laminariae TaxID=454162 RepID=UPI001B7F91B7|nr:RNA methyltransferase [Kiloniella laminariae]
MADRTMKGFFGMGVEGGSKPMNLGNLLRSAHSFGASFFFTVAPNYDSRKVKQSDTSDAPKTLPLYNYATVDEMVLPKGVKLVGVELTEESIELPSFCHPLQAAYVLGPEKGSLSPEMQARCDFIVKIPMKFCVNVGVAGAIVLYDRLISTGKFPARPVNPRAKIVPLPEHFQGGQLLRTRKD